MRPDLTYLDGRVPRVDVIHLHHGVWANLSRRELPARPSPSSSSPPARRRRSSAFPRATATEYKASDTWFLNHMIHNLTPVPDPGLHGLRDRLHPRDVARRRRSIKPARPIWMDVERGSAYPVFNVEKYSGARGASPTRPTIRTPTRRAGSERVGRRPRRRPHRHRRPPPPRRAAQRSLAAGAGARSRTRAAARQGQGAGAQAAARRRRAAAATRSTCSGRRPSTSNPPGAVSWDVAMTATRRTGGSRSRRATCSAPAPPTTPSAPHGGSPWGSWSPSWPTTGPGKNPYRTRVDLPGQAHPRPPAPRTTTTAARRPSCPTRASCRRRGPNPGTVDILGFNYRLGDLRLPGPRGLPPVITPGQSLTYVNRDNPRASTTRSRPARPPATSPPASPIRSPTARSSSSPARWAPTLRSPPAPLEQQTPTNLKPAPTPTSAASIRSCAAPSGSRSSRLAFARDDGAATARSAASSSPSRCRRSWRRPSRAPWRARPRLARTAERIRAEADRESTWRARQPARAEPSAR